MPTEKDRVLELLGTHPKIIPELKKAVPPSTRDVSEAIGPKRRGVSDLLNELEELGIVCYDRGERGKKFWSLTPKGKPLANLQQRMKKVLEDPVKAYEENVEEALGLLRSGRDPARLAGLVLLEHLSKESPVAIIENTEVWDFFTEVLDNPNPYKNLDGFLYYFGEILFPTDIFGSLKLKPFPAKETEEKVIGKLKEYCFQLPPNDNWMVYALQIIRRYDQEVYNHVKKKMEGLCLNPPEKSWLNPALETLTLQDWDQFVTVIEQMVKNLPDEYWDIEPIKNAASRYTGNRQTQLVDRIQKIRTDTTDNKVWERADNLLQELQEKWEKNLEVWENNWEI